MILNEQNGAPSSALPTSDEWLLEPGPVWYTRAAKNGHANAAKLPARLVRSLGDSAWIALLQPVGRWQRVQARNARLAPRREVLELDHAWAAYEGTNGGAFTNGVRTVPGAATNGTPARAQPASTSPRAGLSIAAEPSPAPLPGWVRASDDALRCPDCEAASSKSGRTGRIFCNAIALAQHGKWCPHRPPAPAASRCRARTAEPLPGAAGQNSAVPGICAITRRWPTLSSTPPSSPRTPQTKKYRPRTAPARPPSDASDSLQCPDCGATSGRTGRKFHRIRDLLRHQDVAHRLPDPAAGPIECPDCGATGSRRGTNFRDSWHLAQHRKRCAPRAAKAAPPAESSATGVHQDDRASAPAAAPENGSAAQPSPAQAVRFCAGCGLNLEVLPMPVRFCPACGLGTAAIHAAMGLRGSANPVRCSKV